jgi:hypothetical protein
MTKMTPIGKHPKEHQQWPALLAEKMGCSIHNDGLWAGNNNRTFRKLREFIKTTTVPLDRVMEHHWKIIHGKMLQKVIRRNGSV